MADSSYAYYWARLLGMPEDQLPEYGTPQPGFYRHARTNEPVAIVPDPKAEVALALPKELRAHTALKCYVGVKLKPQSALQAENLWPFCCAHPVKEDEWREVVERGGRWAFEALGANRPPSERGPEKVVEAAREWLDANKSIESANDADQAAELYVELSRAAGDLADDEKRISEPYLRMAAVLCTDVRVWMRQAKDLRPKLLPLIADYMERAKKKRVGRHGFAVTSRGYEAFEVSDPILVLSRWEKDPDVIELATRMARREHKDGVTKPTGWRIEQKTRVQ